MNIPKNDVDCSGIVITAYLQVFDVNLLDHSKLLELDSVSFNSTGFNWCDIFLAKLNFTELSSPSRKDELLLIKYPTRGDLYSRVFFYISGIPPGGTVQRAFNNYDISSVGLTTQYSISPIVGNESVFFDQL